MMVQQQNQRRRTVRRWRLGSPIRTFFQIQWQSLDFLENATGRMHWPCPVSSSSTSWSKGPCREWPGPSRARYCPWTVTFDQHDALGPVERRGGKDASAAGGEGKCPWKNHVWESLPVLGNTGRFDKLFHCQFATVMESTDIMQWALMRNRSH